MRHAMKAGSVAEQVSYRKPMAITQRIVLPTRYSASYFICPRCLATLDREFVAYCDRCGQCLDWTNYKTAEICYPENRS